MKDRPAAAILVLGVVGGVLLVIADFSTIVAVDVGALGTCEELAAPGARDTCQTTGLEQHGGAFVLLGVLAVVMSIGAARGSRPAAAALLAVAGIALFLILVRDVPKIDDSGLVGYEQADAGPRAGLYIEIVGAGLCALAGVMRLTRPGEAHASPRGT